VLTGVGPAAVIRALNTEAAIVFDRGTEVEVSHLRIEGGKPQAGNDPDLNGTLTFIGPVDLRVSDCTISCPAAELKAQACIAVRSDPARTARPDRVRIDHNELLVGALQIGLLVTDTGAVTVEANRVRGVTVRRDDLRFVPRHPLFLQGLAALLTRSTEPVPGKTEPVTPPKKRAKRKGPVAAPAGAGGGLTGAVTDLKVERKGSIEPLAKRFTEYATAARLAEFGSVQKTALRFAKTLAGRKVADLAAPERALIRLLAEQLQPALQGIVVGGRTVGTVQVLDNIVEGAIQGIHIGASDARVGGRESVGEVIVSRNVVHSVVPFLYHRERHAVFVGNARSVHVLDTVASVVRPDDAVVREGPPTPIEAVRVWGVVGPFLLVRQTSARGFNVGVRVTPLEPIPSPKSRMWLVAETVAAGGGNGAVLAPGIDAERNLP
jgi:hypothetical protein